MNYCKKYKFQKIENKFEMFNVKKKIEENEFMG